MMDINLVTLEDIQNILKYQHDDRILDVFQETSDYTSLSFEEIEAYVNRPTDIALDETDYYAKSKFFPIANMMVHLQLPHLLGRSQHLLSLANGLKPSAYLDLGGGSGRDSIVMASQGFDCTYCDIEGPAMELVKWRMAKRNLQATYYNVDELPFIEFDLISNFDVLEHVDDPIHVLASMIARLKVGGMLAISVDFFNFSFPQHLKRDFIYGPVFNELLKSIGLEQVYGNPNSMITVIQGSMCFWQKRTPDPETDVQKRVEKCAQSLYQSGKDLIGEYYEYGMDLIQQKLK